MLRIILICALVAFVEANLKDGEWDRWSVCSNICGGGTQTRHKYCIIMGAARKCGRQQASCNRVACMEPLRFTMYSPCTKPCGRGSRIAYLDGYVNNDLSMDCNVFDCIPKIMCQRNLMMVIDATGSVGVNNWDISKQLAADVVVGAKRYGANMVSVMSYDVGAKTYSHFADSNDKSSLEKAVWDVDYTGSATYLDSAMLMIEENLRDLTPEEQAKTTVVIMNDGPSLSSGGVDKNAIKTAELIHGKGVRVVGFSIGNAKNDELPQLVTKDSNGDAEIIKAESHRDVLDYVENILSSVCRA